MSKTMRDSSPEVENWVQTTMVLIEASSTYAEGGVYDADTDGMIRRIRVVTSALQSALMNINILPPPAAAPTPPAPEPAPAPGNGASGMPETPESGASGAPEVEAAVATAATGAAVARPTTRRGS